jgi:hypothetical protein
VPAHHLRGILDGPRRQPLQERAPEPRFLEVGPVLLVEGGVLAGAQQKVVAVEHPVDLVHHLLEAGGPRKVEVAALALPAPAQAHRVLVLLLALQGGRGGDG